MGDLYFHKKKQNQAAVSKAASNNNSPSKGPKQKEKGVSEFREVENLFLMVPL